MRPIPTLAAIVSGLLTATMLTPVGAAEARPAGASYTERDISDGVTTFPVVTNPGDGATLSFVKGGPVKLLTVRSGRTTLAFKDLNAKAIKYVRRVEELIGAPVALLSTSPERDDTILMRDPFQG